MTDKEKQLLGGLANEVKRLNITKEDSLPVVLFLTEDPLKSEDRLKEMLEFLKEQDSITYEDLFCKLDSILE